MESSTSSGISELQLRVASQSPSWQHVRSAVVNLSGAAISSASNSEFEPPSTRLLTIDLVNLRGSDTRILDVFSLAEGRYNAVRLDIQEITLTFSNGAQFNEVYPVPYIKEMIVETIFPVIVERGRKADVVVDVDLMRSIIFESEPQPGQDLTGIRIEPVGRLVDLASSGQVSGNIKHDNGTPADRRDDVPLLSYPVKLFQPGSRDTVTVYSDSGGQYSAYFIPAGSYALQGPPTDSTEAWSAENIVVTTASTTRKDVVVAKR